jgi:hypothetical protein
METLYMLSHDEKERLLRNIHHEPAWGVAVVLKCTVCLLFVIILTWIGVKSEPGSDIQIATAGSVRTGGLETGKFYQRALEARKVFEERKARYEARSAVPKTKSEPSIQ